MIIAGCGFLGEAAAFLFSQSGARVLGLCASQETAARLAGRPYQVVAEDLTGPLAGISPEWLHPDLLIHCASSSGGGPAAYRAIYRDGLANLIRRFRPNRLISAGSTSVFAQVEGEEVDESAPTQPVSETGKILLQAEAVALEAGGIVARLAGLYGPGRSIYLRKFLDGSAVLEGGGSRWLNLIHRDDAARALVALARPLSPGGVYNVCDDHPTTQRMMYGWVAEILGRSLPPEGPASAPGRRGWTSKRVRNAKLRALGWAPQFPSFREALPSLVRDSAESG